MFASDDAGRLPAEEEIYDLGNRIESAIKLRAMPVAGNA
jgi:hypothetical protein